MKIAAHSEMARVVGCFFIFPTYSPSKGYRWQTAVMSSVVVDGIPGEEFPRKGSLLPSHHF
jgi:hypothetical protein